MKIIASDLDGTLLSTHHDIGETNLEALKYAKSKGVTFIASSGRHLNSINSIFNNVDISPDYIVSCNGTMIHTGNGEVIKKNPLNREKAIKVLEYLEENEYCYCICCEDAMYCLSSGFDRIKNEYNNLTLCDSTRVTGELNCFSELFTPKKERIIVNSFKDVLELKKEIYSIICISIDKNRLLAGREGLKHLDKISIVSSALNNFEVFCEKASKGNALKYLADKLNIPITETMALGDNYNDLSMLEAAHISVAMGNSHDDIKNSCSFTTLTNHEHGVAHAIYKYI